MSNVNTKEHWDTKFRNISKFRPHPFDNLVKIVKEATSSPALIMDLGCALGEFPGLLKESFPGARVIGIDFSDEALGKCGEKYPGIEWVKAALPDLSMFGEDTADVITIVETLEHLDNPENTINEMYRVLKVGGIAVVSVPCGKTFEIIEHVNVWYSEREMGKFIRKTSFGDSFKFKNHGRKIFSCANFAAVLTKSLD